MLKKLFIITLLFGFFATGCAIMGGGGNITPEMQNVAINTTIELSAYELGYYIGNSKTMNDDTAIADAYNLARMGTLPAAEVAKALEALKLQKPQIAGGMYIILKNMGATFAPIGTLESISGISKERWDTAASGYATGYAFGLAGKKALGASAVLKFMPKK